MLQSSFKRGVPGNRINWNQSMYKTIKRTILLILVKTAKYTLCD
jgi:hypothetical protein